MRVDIENEIRIKRPTEELLEWCEKNLVFLNPEYTKKARMGMWLGNTPRTISLIKTIDNVLVVPYGCLPAVTSMCDPNFDVVKNHNVDRPSVDYKCNIPLYDYQQKAVDVMKDFTCGILQAPAGCGKTQIAIALAAAQGKRTLWITHTKDLLEQSKERAERYISPKLIGTITEGKINISKGITFATVQTLARTDIYMYKRYWDCIIVDECHRVASSPTAVTQFGKVLNGLAATYKYGLSATVHRADGLIETTYALLGRVAYVVPDEAVKDRVLNVTVKPMPTATSLTPDCLDTSGMIVYNSLITHLCEDKERCVQIASDLYDNRDHYNLILSHRLAHLEHLMNSLPPDVRETAVMIDSKGQTKAAKAERAAAIEAVRQGHKHFLFATYNLAKEGLDIPRLDRLYMTTPQKDYAIVTQSVGRIARSFEGKGEPIVYDYVDEDIQMMLRAYKKRCTTYRKLGCKFEDT